MKDKKLILIVTGIVLLVLGVVGLTYAWFQANVSGNTNASSVVVQSGTLSLEYINGQEVRGENILPGWSQEKEFTVENKGENDVYYKIEWGNLTNTFINKSDVIYTLIGTTNGNNTPSNLEETIVPDSGINIPALENIKIEPGETHTYTMHVSYANRNVDQSSDIGKILTGKIEVKESRRTVDLEGQALNQGAPVAFGKVEADTEEKSAPTEENGNYLLEDIELGNHTLTIKDSTNQTLSSSQIQIVEGKEESLDGNKIVLSPTTSTYGVDLKVLDNNKVELTKAKYNIEVIVENGTGATTEENITDGATKTYRVTPNEEYEYGSISCTNSQTAQWANNTLTITNLKETTTCTITFNKKKYEAQLLVTNGTGTKTETNIESGTNKEFATTPNTGYKYGTISCTNEQSVSYENNKVTVSNITSNTVCTLNYEAIEYTIKYNANNGSGTTTSSTHTYGAAKALTTNGFTRVGYDFLGWATTAGATTATYTNSQSVENLTTTDGEEINLYAVWQIKTYQTNVAVTNGLITGETTKTTNHGTSVSYTVTPSANYIYDSVTCTNGQSGSWSGNTLTINNVTNTTTCTVNFKIIQFQTSVAVTNGLVTGETTKTANYGSSPTYTVTPTSGYVLDTISCTNGQSGSWSENTLTINNVTNTTTCTVNFKTPQLLKDTILATNGGASAISAKGNPDFAYTSDGCTSTERINKAYTCTSYDTTKISNGMYATKDNLGTTYYYRGVVDNNYVSFAKKIWRIVRINGDNTIRIVLDEMIAEVKYNISDNADVVDKKYVGYMYTTSQTDDTSSNAKNIVDAWYKTNIEDKGYSSKVADAIYCNDRSVASTSTYTTYNANVRLWTNKTPTNICTQAADKFTVSSSLGNGKLTYPIALLTADELSFAGGVTNQVSNFYLTKGNDSFHTMTPRWNKDNLARVYAMGNNSGSSIIGSEVDSEDNIKPVITLKVETKVTGTGTQTDPYVVQ